MIDAMTGAAAFVVNSRQDILAANHLGRAFFAPIFASPAPANMARFTYLDPRAQDFFADWNRAAKECVAALRTAGRTRPVRPRPLRPRRRTLHPIRGVRRALGHSQRSLHRKMEKHFTHPVVGDLTLQYERLSVAGDPGLEIFTYVAEPGSRSEESFTLLADWTSDASTLSKRRVSFGLDEP